MEQINLQLDNFEGPFDLLLKLIRVNKMDITDIKIYEITEQYMAVLRAMEVLDLDIASEFFVLAATLIEIKSRELLPKKESDEAEIPSRELLLHRLQEYEFFHEKVDLLMARYHSEDVLVTRLPMTLEEDRTVEVIIPPGFGPEQFFMLYMELLDRQKEKMNTSRVIQRRIHTEAFKVEDKISQLKEELLLKRSFRFSYIMERSSGKSETIVFFLAILEMVRNLDIVVYQSEAGGELIIREREEEIEDGRQDRE